MSQRDDRTHEVEPEGQALLRTAAADLRSHVEARWVEVADALTSRALRASRPSPPVWAQAPSGPVRVAEQVVVTYLRDRLNPVAGCEVHNVRLEVREERCTGVVIVVVAQFGQRLIPLADDLRTRAESVLAEVLGQDMAPVTVTQMHVHVADVTPGDPSLE